MIDPSCFENCFACGACLAVCTEGALTFRMNDAGFLIPSVEPSKCTECGRCREVCPIDREVDSCDNRSFRLTGSNEIRKSSSSGGAFQLLARKTLEHGGVVFGAAFDQNLSLKITGIDKAEDITLLTGSKYVQADPEKIFVKVKEYLSSGREVLFCSTPCMIHGLKRFIGDEDQNLRTADLVCHGVPSGGLWDRYIGHLNEVNGRKTTAFHFRDKTYSAYGRTVSFSSGNVECHEHHSENKWMRIYQRRISVNECCIKCRYDAGRSVADITLGDLWNSNQAVAECDDPLGISLVVTHSALGRKMLGEIMPDCLCSEIAEQDYVMGHNACPPAIVMLRKLFFNEFRKCDVLHCDIEQLLKKYGA